MEIILYTIFERINMIYPENNNIFLNDINVKFVEINDYDKNDEINLLIDKNDEIELLKYIKPFKDMFGNKFENIDNRKKKMLLIYFALTEHKTFIDNIPKILFQNKKGDYELNGYIKEDKVTIFHISFVFNIFRNYILKKLRKNNETINIINLDNHLLKLLYQYFSVFIIHNELKSFMIIKNELFDNYTKIIQYHLQFLFPNFELGKEKNIKFYSKEISISDLFILRCRIFVSYLLKNVHKEKYCILCGYMSGLLNKILYTKNGKNPALEKPKKKLLLSYQDELKLEFDRIKQSFETDITVSFY